MEADLPAHAKRGLHAMQLVRFAKARLDQKPSAIRREIHEACAARSLIETQAIAHRCWNVGNVLQDKIATLHAPGLWRRH
jgi:hypothetical protein